MLKNGDGSRLQSVVDDEVNMDDIDPGDEEL